MVYNTTDNESSLNITDLASDGEYSVTVAGRDGAGRLGQESEELMTTAVGKLKAMFCIIHTIITCNCAYKMLFHFKLALSCRVSNY